MSDWLGMAAAPRSPRPELKERILARAYAASPRPLVWPLAAAALLLVGLAGGGLLWHRVTRLQSDLAAARDTLGFLRQPGSRVIAVPVVTAGRPGRLTIFADSLSGLWLLTCHNFTPNAPGEAYQLWFVTEQGMRPAALMAMDQPTPMVLAFDTPEGMGRITGMAMSVESRAGSAAPKGPMLFHVDL
jgi:anti-sigma-K factor RskA